MPAFPLSLVGRLLGNWPTVTFTLALALRVSVAQAQTPSAPGLIIQELGKGISPGQRITLDGPRPKGPMSVIYLDGQRLDSTRLASLNPDDVATIEVLKAPIARQLGPDEARLGVLSIVTKAGQHRRAVRRFNKRLARLAGHAASSPAH